MNNPNPFVPQGSLLEEQSKRRSRMKLGVFCVIAVSVTSLMAMLIQGCKRETETADNTDNSAQTVDTNTLAADTNAVDTNTPTMEASNPPVVAPVPTPAPEPAATEYIVVKGDTLGKIAKKNGVTLKALEEANPGVVPTRLKVGEKISIPAVSGNAAASSVTGTSTSSDMNGGEEIYTVKSGDTLTKVAKANGTTVKVLESENNLSTTKIKVGQKLKIPAKAESAAPVTAPESAPVAPPTSPAPSGQ